MHHFKKFSRGGGGMPLNPLTKRMASPSDMQISKTEKKILGPPPIKFWGRPCYLNDKERGRLYPL